VKRCSLQASDGGLDPAQRVVIDKIRNGTSLLLMGPPGSGKTHCALYTLDVFGLRNSEAVLYTAPTADLALQAYANLSETFHQVEVGIVTLLVSRVPSKPKIVVGTPQELWSFLATRHFPLLYTVVIVDEVHTLTQTEIGYSDALHHILQGLRPRNTKQVLALSATVPEEAVSLLTHPRNRGVYGHCCG
jgi:superfamily II DNA or RNA helicase